MKMVNSRGFTLIEVLVAMAMVAIMAAGVMAGLSQQRDKARVDRAFTDFLSVIQPLMMCKSDSNNIREPDNNGGEVLCETPAAAALSAYGTWPDVNGSGHVVLGNYSADGNFDDGSWYFANPLQTTTEPNDYLCCNSLYSRCKVVILNPASNCATADLR